MMKKLLIHFMLTFLPIWALVQAAGGQVQRPVKKQQTTTTASTRKQTTSSKQQSSTKRNTPSTRQQTTPKRSRDAVLADLQANMVYVEGGTFTMGATSEQGDEARNAEWPAHQVTLSSFYIGKYEVTQEEWEAVMGSNPSEFKGAKRPVERVSWDDCQKFIRKLNALTGKQFRLPTEAEWEYAARGGNRSQGYKYAGGNSIGSVAWYSGNSGRETHPVGQKQANELGLYDMAGNVWECCQDWFSDYDYNSSSQTNPTGPSSASDRVFRGGSWGNYARSCRVSTRGCMPPTDRYFNLGLRLALQPTPRSTTLSSVIQNLVANMVHVEGGTFTMGATSEQGSDAFDDEKPAHQVTLSSFSIGKYEVTQEEWEAVMGSNPSRFKGAKRPVEQVSWDDCQEFIRKLNALTGKQFRLPTEAEWEYAARGGNRSLGYKYAGSNSIGSVAWYRDNSGDETHPVGQKQANELGLYDMSGNVWEWCQDWYDRRYYGKSPSNNPVNNTSASNRVGRGGCWSNFARSCRVSFRICLTPVSRDGYLGVRLAL